MSPMVGSRRVVLFKRPFDPLQYRPAVYYDAQRSLTTLAAGMASQFNAASLRYLTHTGNALLRGGSTWHRYGWIYLDSTAATKTIVATRVAGATTGGYGVTVNATPALALGAADGAANYGATHPTTLSTATWYFWYAEYDGANIGISLNGGALTQTPMASFAAGVDAFNIGASTTPANYFDGRQQCLGGGDGVLSAAQRTALYNSGTPLSYAQTLSAGITPGFFFPLDEASGARVDLVGALSLTNTNTVGTAAGTCLQATQQRNDLSGNAKHASQSTQANKPRYRTAIINGLPVDRFDGSNDYWTFTATALGTTNTLCSVVRPVAAPGAGLQVVLGNASGEYGLAYDNTNLYYKPAATVAAVSVAHGGLSAGTAYVMTVVRSGTSVSFYINGSQKGTTQTLGSNDVLTLASVGAYSDASQPMNADHAVSFLDDSAYGTSQQKNVERYLGRRYGLAIAA